MSLLSAILFIFFNNTPLLSVLLADKDWFSFTKADEYGCGKYADDCYKVFCRFQWNDVEPTDHALNDYVDWAREKYA